MPQRVEIGIDCIDPERLAPFWARALGYRIGDLDGAGVYLDLIPPLPTDPIVYLQRVPEAKTVKNRVHLDLYLEQPEVLIGELVALGGSVVGDPQGGSEGGWWQVMHDPEGHEFCVCRSTASA